MIKRVIWAKIWANVMISLLFGGIVLFVANSFVRFDLV